MSEASIPQRPTSSPARMPSFTADASLQRAGQRYRVVDVYGQQAAAIHPAQGALYSYSGGPRPGSIGYCHFGLVWRLQCTHMTQVQNTSICVYELVPELEWVCP